MRKYLKVRSFWRDCYRRAKDFNPELFEEIMFDLEVECERDLDELCVVDENPNVLRYYYEIYEYGFAGREGLPS